MAYGPDPLAIGTVLDERYTVQAILGQGGFGITYLASDGERTDNCVVKELAPSGATRGARQLLLFDAIGEAASRNLRHQFTREARVLRSLNVTGIPHVRDAFEQHGTAYFVCDEVPNSRSLEALLMQTGRMSEPEVLDFLEQCCEILSVIHGKGILHRDLKPSNILIDGNGKVHLIDFGSARAWHQDLTVQHTVQFTPGYAPPEQLSERGRRSPATDIYGLCATAYAMLASEPPTASTDRLAGVPIKPIQDVRPEISEALASAIMTGLAWRMSERPQTVASLLDRLKGDLVANDESVEDLDARRLLLSHLRFGKRECPACHGVLESPKPAQARRCIVCRSGQIHKRDIADRRCAVCRTGSLHQWTLARNGPRWCPVCRFGELRTQSVAIPWKPRTWTCQSCSESFVVAKSVVTRAATGDEGTWSEWLGAALRTEISHVCDACHAQFDEQDDGRWRLLRPRPKTLGFRDLYPDEWARVASGLDPGQGNAACAECGADYFAEDDHITLLDASEDPYGTRDEFLGVRLDSENARWVAAGKRSGVPGLVCQDCATEFDLPEDNVEWMLWSTSAPTLIPYVGESQTPENWHRRGARLPLVGDESELDESLAIAIRRAYAHGDLHWSAKRSGSTWSGPATWLLDDGQANGTLTIDSNELSFGGLLRKRKLPMSDLHSAKAKGDQIDLVWADDSSASFLIEPQVIQVPLKSGSMDLELTAKDLAARLHRARAR